MAYLKPRVHPSNMSQLLQTVKFKQISSELTDDEFDLFLCSLHRRNGKELMLQILCQQQHASLDPTEMLQISSNIIQKRKKQQQQTNQWTLDTLPKSFTGEIASNLNQTDYASFSLVNRSIYIGCNDPNRLLSLSTPCSTFFNENPDITITLSKYPHLRNLEMELKQRGHVSFANGDSPICKKLQSLKLHHDQVETDNAVNNFLAQESITVNTFENLQYLLLGGFCDIGNAQTFERIFSKFNTIEHLELSVVNQSTDFNVLDCEEILKKSLPNLNALTLECANVLGSAILKYRGSGLIRLELKNFKLAPPLSLNELKETDFSKLQKLSIGNVRENVVSSILKTARNLVAVHWIITGKERESAAEDNQDIGMIHGNAVGIMDKCSGTLTQMHLDCSCFDIEQTNRLENVCKTIELALHATRSRYRDSLRIGIEGGENLMESNLYFHRILNKITSSNTREYVLFWKMFDSEICVDCFDDTEDGICSGCESKMNMRDNAVQDAVSLVNDTQNAEVLRTGDSLYIIKSEEGTLNSYEKWWNKGKWNDEFERVIY